MAEADEETRHQHYISHLKDSRGDGLGEFFHEELTYNGEPMTHLDYRSLVAGDIALVIDSANRERVEIVHDGPYRAARVLISAAQPDP